MWYKVSGGDTIPSEVDSTSSRLYVYIRRNINFVSAAGEENPAHYEWEEIRIPKDVWPIYQKTMSHDDALDDVYAALTELAEMIIGE